MTENINITPAAFFTEISHALAPKGQALADDLAITTRGGCFEFCDGDLGAASKEVSDIFKTSAQYLDNPEVITQEAKDALLVRAEAHASKMGIIAAMIRKECPGGYSLYENDDELYDENGEPCQRACPMQSRINTVVHELYNDGTD